MLIISTMFLNTLSDVLGLYPTKLVGLDDLSYYIIIDYVSVLAEPFLHIFSIIITSLVFLSIWKNARVYLIFKSFTKVFKCIFYEHLFPFWFNKFTLANRTVSP